MYNIIFRVILMIALLIPVKMFSQKRISYQVLDSLSQIIRNAILEANNTEFPFDTDKSICTFPKDNFGIQISNHLAYKAQTIKYKDSIECTNIIEDVDMTEAQGIFWDYNKDKTKLIVTLEFKSKSINGVEYKNGEYNTLTFSGMIFASKLNDTLSDDNIKLPPLAETIFYLCNQLRVEKNLVTKQEVESETKDIGVLSFEDFVAAHPNSLLTPGIKNKIITRKKEALKKINEDLVKLFTPDNLRLGMSMAQFKSTFPNIKLDKGEYSAYYNMYTYNNLNHDSYRKNSYEEGIDWVSFRNDSLVCIEKSVAYIYRNAAETKFNDYNEMLHKIVPEEYFSKLMTYSGEETNSLYDAFNNAVSTSRPGVVFQITKSYASDRSCYKLEISVGESK